jgi:diguanylate cyclase (GGDEF)-like protein
VLLYDPASRTISPLTSDRPDDDRLGELSRRWSRIPLDDFPAARSVLLDQQPVDIEDGQRDVRLPPGMAADFGVTSLHLEPLWTTEPVGMLAIEPAGAASNPDLESIVPLVAASVARVQARRSSEVEHPEKEWMLDLIEAASEQDSLDGVLATICERLARQLGSRRAAVFLLDDGRAVPRMARPAEGSCDPDDWELFRSAATPLPLVEAALEAGDAVIADNPESPLVDGWWAQTFGTGSALAAPLGRRTDVLGVIALDSPTAGAFSESDGHLLADAAARLGGIVELARAMEERTTNLQAATTIRRLLEEGSRATSVEEAAEALAKVSRDALDTEHASVFLAGEDGHIAYVAVDAPDDFQAIASERLVGSSAQEFRLWRRLTRQREPVFVEDATQSQLIPAELVALLRLRAYVAFPLLSADAALGIVVCSDTRGPRHWTDDERQLVEQLSLEGSLIIENAALRTTSARRIDELSRQAFHDSLTELPNRSLFKDRLEHALARTRRGHQSVAVMLLDLDGFKEINDNYGHDAGDQVLVAVAQRLRASLRPADTVARLGGDEFTTLLEDIAGEREATRVAERIESSLRTPFVVEGNETHLTISIGIALNEPGETNPGDLLRNADRAMYKAKQEGKGGHVVYRSPADGGRIGDLGVSEGGFPLRGPRIGRSRDRLEENGPSPGRPDQADRN